MAELDKETIKKLTRLCRIDCTEEEQESLLKDLKKILDYIEQLQEIDTENVQPCNHVLDDIANVMREDAVGEVLDREVFLANAPSHIGGMIRVPPVIKQN
ncbi:Asp-tRNA(Asn)/Glu-tRNA(Gln) amidotransferase subunit GatC [Candidatus Protochlamydia phocaeensis]|uniref:Asp-tRNA(Asn)/Glu-tRNA(Gln) amidotransferase subunit GatC n=1 Tax=Candidatus Protochlamydia phocaeensis TaxID=1414722 RepID=UPI00083930CB|nr:Asp-tRNA(Asn)/Glu-tRNA(Gln) amidotransferase subunit GatC [Candidatus Protochlamydia phocaeensis]